MADRRMTAGVGLACATLVWLAALVIHEPSLASAGAVLFGAAGVAVLCGLTHALVLALANRYDMLSPLMFSHYLQGLLVFVAYVSTYAIDPEWFLQSWRSIYFGYYLFDIAMILICWKQLVGSFRDFYSLHHVFSFGVTALWMVVGGEWLDYIILGVMIWLASDLWLYALSLYRCTIGRRAPRARIASLQLSVFWIERTHRMAAYLIPCILADFSLSSLAWLVFITGASNDLLDATFQWKALRGRRLRARRTASPQPVLASPVRAKA